MATETEKDTETRNIKSEKNNWQYREIGETDWDDCTKEWYEYCSKSPEYDTRIA